MSNPFDTNTEAASPFSFGSVFDRATGLAADFGSTYLTVKAQEKIATEQAKAQARLNSYSAANPSLGAVNPGAAARVAGQSPVQQWLPWGSPIVGTAGAVGGNGGGNGARLAVYGLLGVGVLFLVWKLIKKL